MTTPSPTELARELVARAKANGADAADAVFIASSALSVTVRNGTTEELERSETTDLGLRVFRGKRSAIISTSNLDPTGFDALAAQAMAMADVLPPDDYAGLPPQNLIACNPDSAALELNDPTEPDAASLLERAKRTEEAGRSVAGVTNSAGASASWGRTTIALVSSEGMEGSYARSGHSISMSALAGRGTGMQRDYDYHSAVFLSDLESPESTGQSAGEKAVARLNPVRPRTGILPVVFVPRVANSLLGSFASAISGASVARGTSFLKDRMGQKVFADGIRITDDPRRVRGLRSRPFDGEGVEGEALHLVEDGVLQSWLLDCRSARQLGLTTNARAVRGVSSPPAPGVTNLFFEPGRLSPAELMADIREGICITEMMGSAVNGLTGDYSRGASGFMIRDGQIAEPVAEFTVAGNLADMFARLHIADDLSFRFGINSPTLRIDGMSIAGD